jgi:hypothetical protein
VAVLVAGAGSSGAGATVGQLSASTCHQRSLTYC